MWWVTVPEWCQPAKAGGGLLASLFWGCFTVGRLLGIPISLRFSPETILKADLLLAVLSASCMLVFGQGNPAVLWCGTAVFGLSMACTYPQAKVLPATYGYPITGVFMSLVMVAGSLGNVIFVMAVAQLFGNFGPSSFFPAVVGVLALTAAASAVISVVQHQQATQRHQDVAVRKSDAAKMAP